MCLKILKQQMLSYLVDGESVFSHTFLVYPGQLNFLLLILNYELPDWRVTFMCFCRMIIANDIYLGSEKIWWYPKAVLRILKVIILQSCGQRTLRTVIKILQNLKKLIGKF
jgi:hypothetical protein